MGAASLPHYLVDRQLLVSALALATLLVALFLLVLAATQGGGTEGVFVAEAGEVTPFRWR
jgi:hypothetical protein